MNKKRDILKIAESAVGSVSPYEMISKNVKLHGKSLMIGDNSGRGRSFDLSRYAHIYVIGAGKATAPMARALETILGKRISRGAIAVKPGHTAELKIIRQIEGGHPVPNDGSTKAAREILRIADGAEEADLVINIISGGGSALLTLPHPGNPEGGIPALTLEDMQSTTQEFLACGAPIQEINCIRKHISAVKGGRLTEHLHPAASVNLILSDVVGDDLQNIASGPTVPDHSIYSEALQIVTKYGLQEKLPPRVTGLLHAGSNGRIPETPKPGAACFSRCSNILLGTNALALQAAAIEARHRGYHPVVLSSRITGESREIAKFYAALAQEAAAGGVGTDSGGNSEAAELAAALTGSSAGRHSADAVRLYTKPVCILAGGETTVTLRGNGKGGRNQEMALAMLAEIAARPDAFAGTLFASVATDGNDGPTDAAGAFASVDLAEEAEKAGLSIDEYLANNDAYTFFNKIDGLIITGPTNTNVCDIQIILAEM